MRDTDIKYMTEALVADLAEFLSRDFDMSVTESLNTLYNSEVYSKLIDRSTGLYFQSSKYIYSFLKQELATGKLA